MGVTRAEVTLLETWFSWSMPYWTRDFKALTTWLWGQPPPTGRVTKVAPGSRLHSGGVEYPALAPGDRLEMWAEGALWWTWEV